MCSGTTLGWIVEKALEGWVAEKIVGSLALFHKNRVIQIRRGTRLDQLYHMRTTVNSADLGTRSDKLKILNVGPGSVWQEGYPWMKMDIDEAVENG